MTMIVCLTLFLIFKDGFSIKIKHETEFKDTTYKVDQLEKEEIKTEELEKKEKEFKTFVDSTLETMEDYLGGEDGKQKRKQKESI